jgi:hypothetical protein
MKGPTCAKDVRVVRGQAFECVSKSYLGHSFANQVLLAMLTRLLFASLSVRERLRKTFTSTRV